MNCKDAEMVGETLGKSVRAVHNLCNIYTRMMMRTIMQKATHYYHVGAEFVYYFLYTALPWVTPQEPDAPDAPDALKAPKEEMQKTEEGTDNHIKTE